MLFFCSLSFSCSSSMFFLGLFLMISFKLLRYWFLWRLWTNLDFCVRVPVDGMAFIVYAILRFFLFIKTDSLISGIYDFIEFFDISEIIIFCLSWLLFENSFFNSLFYLFEKFVIFSFNLKKLSEELFICFKISKFYDFLSKCYLIYNSVFFSFFSLFTEKYFL